MSNDIIQRQANGALWITLNRPHDGNRVTAPMISTLAQALKEVPEDVKLILIRAEGADFCKGRDYQAAPEDADRGQRPSALQIQERMTTPILDLYAAIKGAPVPTVSVVQGHAAGFGCALAGACDLVLASDTSRFSLPEMRERGLPPSLAMTALLDRVNFRTLVYLAYSTQEIDAKTALMAGLVSALHPETQIEDRAKALADAICAQPSDSIRAVKNYLKLAPDMEPRGRAALGGSLFAIVAGSR